VNFLTELEPWVAAALLAAIMIAAWCAGWRSGRARREGGQEPLDTRLDDAGLALLGLLLAFSFSMAINKYDHRRVMLITDTNAIGDFYTCASLIAQPTRTELQDVIRDYTSFRLQMASGGWKADLEEGIQRFGTMHGRMTVLVREALATGTPIAVPLVNTLNALTSSHAARLAAVRDRLPGSIILLLVLAAGFSAGLVGRQQLRPSILGNASFIVIVTLTFYIILDLNQPTRGLIQISQEPMQRLLASMAH
jgi:hypothetical protein